MSGLVAGLSALVGVLFAASLLVGPDWQDPGAALLALAGRGDPLLVLVMQELRLPRAILGAAVGAALGMAGAAMQGLLRNPLAEPGLIGTSGSAALGAVLAIQTGLAAAIPFALPVAALAGAGIAVGLVLALAGPRGGALALILAGIAISALAGALTSLVLNLSPNPFAANEIIFWMLGSLADRSMLHVAIAGPVILAGAVILWPARRALRALSLGEDAAASLGIGLGAVRARLAIGTAAMVGGATAVAGTIGFVGLVVPHLLRRRVGGDPGRLVAVSGLGGAAMVLAADIAVRLVLPGRDLKLGVLTALIGAPFFLHLILRQRGERA